MRGRRWWIGFVVVILLGLLAWLVSHQSPVGTWLTYGAWGVVVVAVVVRAMRPGARGHRMRSSVGPAFDGLIEVQNLYLGRPDVGPVTYGSDGPPTTELALERTEPEPGDLRRADREV